MIVPYSQLFHQLIPSCINLPMIIMAYSSWWPSSSWEADWTTSGSNQDRHWNNTWTPPKSSKRNQDSKTFDGKYQDWNSPTGFKTRQGLPTTFVQTKSHLDSREIYGKTMLRKIAPTAWSSKYGLAGQNMEQVKLVDLIRRGWENQHLRALSHGSYMSMIVCRKVNEAVFLQAFLSLVREKKWDLDDLACHFCKSRSIAEPSKSHPSVEEVKVHQAQALAKFLLNRLSLLLPTCLRHRLLLSKRLNPFVLSLKLRKHETVKVQIHNKPPNVVDCKRSKQHLCLLS